MRRVGPIGWILGGSLLGAALWACADHLDPAAVSGPDPYASASSDARGAGSSSGDVANPLLDPFAADVTYDYDGTFAGTRHPRDGGAPPPATNPDCLACHGADQSDNPKYVAAGYLVDPALPDGGGPPCAACEVLFVDSAGHRVRTVTAADGTFALTADQYGAVSAKTYVGVRKDARSAAMPISESVDEAGVLRGCNGARCHATGAEKPITPSP